MRLRNIMLAASCLLIGSSAKAMTEISVKGNLLPPVCRVHDGNNGAIHVDFGDEINVNRLDGHNYRQRVQYQISCGEDGQTWPLRLRFSGVTQSWDPQALETTLANLGVRLILEGNNVDFGVDIPIANSTNLPQLFAVPVINITDIPNEGLFSATANVQAEYY